MENILIEAENSFDGTYVIKEGTVAISSYAFMNVTSLYALYIPESVSLIANDAFNNCISLLEVYYGGSEEKWLTLNDDYFANGNEALVYAYVNFDTEALPEAFVDCDGDGMLTISDLAYVKLLLSCAETLVDKLPDINRDGVFDTADLATLKLMLANI